MGKYMIKNVHIKFIMIFFVLGVLAISILSFLNINMLYQLKEVSTQDEVVTEISNSILQTEIVGIVMICVFVIITIIIGFFLTKLVTKPINKLIESAEKIADGEEVQIEETNKGDSQVEELVNAFRLMTGELKQNLNEIVKQKKQIETILLHMTDGVIAFDMEGKIIHINPAAVQLLALTQEENDFNSIFKRLNSDINLEKIVYLENWTSSEQKLNIGDKYIYLLFAPFQDENNKPAGVIVVIQDITEHVKLDNMRKEFVADVSHELKTPITSIMGYADTLIESEYDKEMQEKFLGVISSEARRMAKLVTDLLTLSRFDNKKIVKEETQFDLGELTKKCIERLQLEVEKKEHHVECFVTANVPPVKADKYGLERVILNIISNAIKYTPRGNTIIISVFESELVYSISIENQGITIPEKELDNVFAKFYRLDKSGDRSKNSYGLGLATVKRILTLHNSDFSINNGQNSVIFKFTLKKQDLIITEDFE